ncbi:WD repeat protein, putative [Trichomonas vaginalis G3]|uniref:Beta'-coat protein n=1 Tax=Trichomonas vaginalis (strain ATCC PRA-98 / G3) TaxID=412133 RepID=A2EQL7_TRIV3|nr:beta'-COP family [Trichomonas vaginalis G3]EAY05064.1 WD repeat protein, putative [Trichomonas vaginalis G3]KAI5488996.1 beta'-COP family [Trichomonas vaginalis G3]|eukprot:XP_001317287.1 WD repeat protein [Trichomonas vaginalis G3]
MCLSRSEYLFGLPTARVKCIDFHESNQLLLAALFSGTAIVVDTLAGNIVKSYTVHEGSALRTCRWIHKTGNFVVGGDRSSLVFYSFGKNKLLNTVENAAVGPVRSIAVHPSENLILSCGDDKLVKLWDISNEKCKLVRVFSAHSKLVIDVKWSLREPTNFASCSYDGTVIFWETSSTTPMFTLKVCSLCVNCISFASVREKSQFAASTDDHNIYIVDIQSRSVVTKLEEHENNVSRVELHPTRPILISVSEDSKAIAWSSSTYKKENTILSNYKRMWSLAFSNNLPFFAIGCDDGLSVYKFTMDGIPMSLDSSGKIIVSHTSEIVTANLKELQNLSDNSELQLVYKDALTTDFQPEYMKHSPNGKFVYICGSGEYVIYSTLGFRNKAYGNGKMVAWSSNSTDFAVLTENGDVEIHLGNDEPKLIKNSYATNIFGGYLLGIQNSSSLTFYDWKSNEIIRKIEIEAEDVIWDGQRKIAIRTKDTIFVLSFNSDYSLLESEQTGYSDSFSILFTYETASTSICFANGVLLFTNETFLYRCVLGIYTVHSKMLKQNKILGYLQKENVLIVSDHLGNLTSICLPLSLLDFELLVSDNLIEEATEKADSIPDNFRAKEARVMRQIGQRKLALSVANDKQSRFDIAVELNDLTEANNNASDETQYKKVARMALEQGNYEIAVESLKNCHDYSTLLLLYKGRGDADGVRELIDLSSSKGQLNVAFTCAMLINDKRRAVEILIQSKLYAEATLLARSAVPEMVNECFKLWKENAINQKVADSLADPQEYPNLFE